MKLALTFDDGPCPQYTDQIIDLLLEYSVPATFFVVGKHVREYPETVMRIRDEGFEIGNHSYSHRALGQIPSGEAAVEILECQREIYKAVGIKPSYFRPPYGNIGPTTIGPIAKSLDLYTVLWDVSTGDWGETTTDAIAKEVFYSDGGIVLMHDGSPDGTADRQKTVDALEMILEKYPQQTFVKIGELLQ